ncbi:saccharopine dehydrogenase-like oxidoreductase [Diorhabda sublineata]|uniref:saccharopine dehydrogenase-like oxidoreductase n=1 Tax=Diorhabda sublineata TaxID=1163346 RepID=UPI0024E17DE8|nr:saccharopine dehydrogenase-like oxidoreductase [Diorhabda sublineata]
MADPTRLDLVILGATGFTGLHCVPYVFKVSKEKNLTWGVAGRSEDKLKDVLEKMGKKVEADLSGIPIIITDIKDDDSLLKMAQRAKVVINCCGPYRFLGMPVVKACVTAGTNYVDVTGEPQFMETVLLEYDELAREKGIYIVNACGFDCIPSDYGLVYLQDKFDGVLNSAVTYLKVWVDGKVSGPNINYGTWHSLVYGLKHATELSELRKKLFSKRLPSFKPKLKSNTLPHRSDKVKGWILPFPGADRSVMKRTQRYLYENESKRPIQVDTFFTVRNFIEVIGIVLCFLLWSFLVKFEFGKRWLLNYPNIFTLGFFSKDETPSEETIEKQFFQITFYGEGWKEKLEDKDDEYSTPPNKQVIAQLKGKNPGYGTTCAGVVGAALMIATEKDKLPQKGGVYTPGAAFKNTTLMKYLMDNEITFEIISEKDL